MQLITIEESDFVRYAKQFFEAVSGELDGFTTRKGKISVESYGEVSLFTPSHIQFAKYGRKAGKKPPLDPILRWVREKGVIRDDENERQVAFAIQKYIGDKGTEKGRAFSSPPSALGEAIEKHLPAFRTQFGDHFSLAIDSDLYKIYKTIFPEKMSYIF